MRQFWSIFLLVLFALSAKAQHVELHWYILKSVAPLDVVDGKMALTRIRQFTNDSLSTFVDRDDYFSVATHTPIEWASFNENMTAAGYPVADITDGEIHHAHYVKMGLAYQQSIYFLQFSEQLNTIESPIVLTTEEFELLNDEQKSAILNHPNHFLIKQ